MNFIYKDNDYIKIIEDIILNKEFRKIDNSEHHGTTRFNHCVRVSYVSYKLSKLLKLNSYNVARAGLLHDFFVTTNNRNSKERFKSTITHSKQAYKNADKLFSLDEMQKDIIISHMFPFGGTPPKYLESGVVNFVDKIVGCYEFISKFTFKLNPIATVFIFTITRYL